MKLLVGVTIAALSTIMVSSMVAYPLQMIEAVSNAHFHGNSNDNTGEHFNAGAVTNEGGRDGYHENVQNTCNDNNGKCHFHDNVKDR